MLFLFIFTIIFTRFFIGFHTFMRNCTHIWTLTTFLRSARRRVSRRRFVSSVSLRERRGLQLHFDLAPPTQRDRPFNLNKHASSSSNEKRAIHRRIQARFTSRTVARGDGIRGNGRTLARLYRRAAALHRHVPRNISASGR